MKNMECVLESNSVDDTERIGSVIGGHLRGGELIELVSDLGGGKTTFTRGLVAGAGSKDAVASPTFTLSRLYSTPKFEVHHFDFYRLTEAGLAAYELEDLLGQPEIVVVVEWGAVVSHVLPKTKLTIAIAQTGDNQRTLTCSYPPELAYVLEGLC